MNSKEQTNTEAEPSIDSQTEKPQWYTPNLNVIEIDQATLTGCIAIPEGCAGFLGS